MDGHGELQHAILSEKQAKAAFKSWVKAQSEASVCLEKWAAHEANPAIQDCFAKLSEINKLWLESQLVFAQCIKDYREALEAILVQELSSDAATKHMQKCEKHERQCEKDIQRLQKKGESTAGSEARLRQARSLRELADSSRATATREKEHFKHRLVVESLESYADAQISLFEKGIAVCRGYKDLLRQLPPGPVHLTGEPYMGADATAHTVLGVTEALRSIELLSARQIVRNGSAAASGTPISLSPPLPPRQSESSNSMHGLARASAPTPQSEGRPRLGRAYSTVDPPGYTRDQHKMFEDSPRLGRPPARSFSMAAMAEASHSHAHDMNTSSRDSTPAPALAAATPTPAAAAAVPPRPSAAALGYDVRYMAEPDSSA